jgi:uncharacterized membrane protein YdjX (TVP38/TMEM64 family)
VRDLARETKPTNSLHLRVANGSGAQFCGFAGIFAKLTCKKVLRIRTTYSMAGATFIQAGAMAENVDPRRLSDQEAFYQALQRLFSLIARLKPLDRQVILAPRISLDFVRHQAEKLNSRWRLEMRVMFLAFVATIVVLVAALVLPPSPAMNIRGFVWAVRAGSFLLMTGAAYVWFEARRRGQLLTLSRHEGVVHTLDAYRSELQRRRNYYLSAWRWSAWPVIPAGVVTLGGAGLYDPRPGKWVRVAVVIGLAIVFIVLVVLHDQGKGRKYQRELDALASLI